MSESIPRYWGVYFPETKQWAKKPDGQLYYYPSPAIATAHLEDWQNATIGTVDGRGRPIFTEQIVVREMVAGQDVVADG